MTLKDQMAADLTSVFLNSNEFAQAATYLPKNASATPFAVTIQIGDPSPAIAQIFSGQEDRRPAQALVSRTAINAGITANTGGVVREAMRGDKVTVASGAFAGVWKVDTFHADEGDGLMLNLVFSEIYAPGGAAARQGS